MPIYFGPSWNQRQPWPGGKTPNDHYQPGDVPVVGVTFETDRSILEQYVPKCFTLNAPIVTVLVCEFRHLGWMAGLSYNLVNINCPVHFKGERDDLDGDLILAMFENNPDPVIGGREILGYSKLYCEIPPIRHDENKYIATASAYDFQFMKLEIDTSKPAADVAKATEWEKKSAGKVHFKYIPGTMEKGDDPKNDCIPPDIAYPVINPKWVKPDDYPYELRKPEITWCDGTIQFNEPTWYDWPTNGNVGKGLASLPVKKVLAARQFIYDEPCEYANVYRLR
jgi:acetoacetate decarboxylase